MTERSFPRTFRRLVGAFHRYHDVPREPARVVEKATARIELDDARAEARRERGTHPVDPPTPDFVEPGLGTDSRTIAGKVAAACFVVIAIGAIVLVARLLDGVDDQPVEVVEGSVAEEITSPASDLCRWDVVADLRNATGERIVIRSARVETTGGLARLVTAPIELPPASVTSVELSFVVPNPCPETAGALAPGQIRVNEGSSGSSRFVPFTIRL